MKWELWGDATTESFFPADNTQARSMALDEGLEPLWTCDAPSYNAAMRKLYAHLGRGEYQPVLAEDGRPYPEGEDGSPPL